MARVLFSQNLIVFKFGVVNHDGFIVGLIVVVLEKDLYSTVVQPNFDF